MAHLGDRLKPLRGWLVPLLLLGMWEYTSHRDALHAYAFAPLEQMVTALGELIGNGDLWANSVASLERTSIGLLLGVAAGIGVGVLMAFSRIALTLINPLYQSVRQLPLLALTPLVGMWMGNGEPSKVLIISLAAFYPMVLSTYEGLRHVDARYTEVARVFRLNRRQSFRQVQLPAALPSVVAGLQQAVSFAWIAAVGSELLFNVGPGLGNLMMIAENNARMDVIIVCTASVTALGFAMSYAASLIASRLQRWRH